MAITITVIPQETLVRSGQPVNFMLSVANTDGATREVAAITPVGVTPGIAANFGVKIVDGTVADSSTVRFPFSAVFYASSPATSGGTSDSQTVQFKVNVQIDTTAGAVSSQKVSDTISMSVVPNSPTISIAEITQFGMLDFESNNQLLPGLLLGLI
jgi:hypothetical protein